ncbi:hypothetical protein [Bacillus horti]|uniref:Bulb-type lectin domain-containing protein n=1 Tax=Caldalkalibacillus horti TaxID=77523 RepID=A0ABT9VYX0_9BACI|nr:hypothetical protein [Bacillus horti]MDQ0166193.1 hypothetical protein [Bacillus horti]
MGFGSADNQIHVANRCGENIYVIPMPNKDWVWGDIGFTVLTTILTFGEAAPAAATAINSLSRLQKAITLVKSILGNPYVKAIKYAALEYKIARNGLREVETEILRKAEAARKEIITFLKSEGALIKPNEFKQVSNEKNYNPLRMISPSGWGGLFGASDAALFIATESLSRFALFNTNSDYSWIVEPNMVVRSKYGHIWESAKSEGYYRFSASDRLVEGQDLKPNESISSPNKSYDFVYQEDGNAVIYERRKPDGEKAIWASDTYGKAAWRTCMQDDGNFVVYEAEGKPVWATDKCGYDPMYEGCSLVMQDDGNLVIYNKDNKVIWASGTYR